MPTPDELLATKQAEAKTLADEYNAGQEEINEKTKAQQELLQKILKITGAIEALQDLKKDAAAPDSACEVVSE